MRNSALFIVFVLFSGLSVLTAQPLIGDIRVNDDSPQPITIQDNPHFFSDGSNGFYLTWRDSRTGSEEKYAQHFTDEGIKTGPNYRVYDDYDFCPVSQTAGMFFSGSINYYYPMSYSQFRLSGKVYNSTGQRQDSIVLGSCIIPECGTGWNPYSQRVIVKNGKYYVFFANNGDLELRTVDTLGNLLTLRQLPVTNVSAFYVTLMPDKSIGILYRKDQWDPNTSKRLWGIFLNAEDSVSAQPADPVFSIPDDQDLNISSSPLRPISASEFQLLWISLNAKKIYADVFTTSGSWVQSARQSIDLPAFLFQTVNFPYMLRSYSVNPLADKYDLYVSMLYYAPAANSERFFNSLFTFNSNGSYTGQCLTDTTPGNTFYENLFKSPSGKYFNGFTDNKDIFLRELNGLSPVSQSRVNDDTFGSNEDNAVIIPVNDQKALITYKNEAGTKCRFISASGTPLGAEKNIAFQMIRFFTSGNAVAFWSNGGRFDSSYAGLCYLNENLEEIRRDTFKVNGTAVKLVPYYSDLMLLDSGKVLLVTKLSPVFLARVTDLSGQTLRELALTDVESDKITLHKHNQTSVYFNCGYMRLYDNDLQPLAPKSQKINMSVYLGNHRYLSIFPEQPLDIRKQAMIATIQGDTINSSFYLTNYIPEEMQILPVNGTCFIVLTKYQDKFYAKTFLTDGIHAYPVIQVMSTEGRVVRNMTMSRAGSSLIFTRSDNKAGNLDIWAARCSLSDITSVTAEPGATRKPDYTLAQNFPNPFNPSTRISYFLPEQAIVKISIFDILGREISVLLNAKQGPGNFSIDFRPGKLASGIYIYKLQTNTGIELTNKMIYLK